MDAFPDVMKVSTTMSPKLDNAYHAFVTSELRKEIYISLMKKEMYYSLDSFAYGDHPKIQSIVDVLQTELRELGWETALAYGNTALFVYHGKKPDSLPL